MLSVKQFVFNPFGESTYVVSDDVSRQAIVVDPGMINPSEQRRLDNYISEQNLHIVAVVNTHLHLDHCFGDNYVHSRYDAPILASAADAPLGASVGQQSKRFGMNIEGAEVEIDRPIADGDKVDVGSEQLNVIAVPGHSPGGLALYSPTGRFVLSGDSLFHGSIGRTDLLGGDYQTLINSVADKLLSLPDDTLVLPGHGDATTIAQEKQCNPYFS